MNWNQVGNLVEFEISFRGHRLAVYRGSLGWTGLISPAIGDKSVVGLKATDQEDAKAEMLERYIEIISGEMAKLETVLILATKAGDTRLYACGVIGSGVEKPSEGMLKQESPLL